MLIKITSTDKITMITTDTEAPMTFESFPLVLVNTVSEVVCSVGLVVNMGSLIASSSDKMVMMASVCRLRPLVGGLCKSKLKCLSVCCRDVLMLMMKQ